MQNRFGFALVLSQTGQEVGVSRATRTSRGIPASDDHLIPAALVPHLDHQAVSRGKAGWPNRGHGGSTQPGTSMGWHAGRLPPTLTDDPALPKPLMQ